MRNLIVSLIIMCCSFNNLFAQASIDSNEIKINFNKEGSKYFKVMVTNQIWFRLNQSNPGTIADNVNKPVTFDIGIRRLRLQLIGQLHKKFMIYVQFGMNNFNAFSPRKVGDFFHDAVVEYTPINDKQINLSMGGGLTGWTGYSRFSSPAIASLMGMDAPLYQQSTNDVNDQFLRKLSFYLKGNLWKFNYRLVLSDPFTISSSNYFDPNISQYSNFTNHGRYLQPSGYISYEIFDHESHILPYNTGTYLGTKKVLNIGAGFVWQKSATWNTSNGNDTIYHDMFLLGADIFYDSYLGKNKNWAISVYASYGYLNYGPGYLRELGVMNPGQSVNAGTPTINGPGNSFPILGTGQVGYLQAGLMLPKKWFGKKSFAIMPYFNTQIAKWDRLTDIMLSFDTGINFLLDNHRYKFTIDYQNRPIFSNVNFRQVQRNSMITLQFQIAI